MKFSYSRLSTYEECERKYFWRYVVGIETERSFPAQVGTFFHEIMPIYSNNGLDCALAEIDTFHDKLTAWLDDEKYINRYGNAARRATKALIAVDKWAKLPSALLTEFDISRKYNNELEFHGIVDALTIQNDKLWTVEYKTGKPNKERLLLYDWQARLYAWLTGAVGTIFVLVNTSVQNIKERHIQIRYMGWTDLELQITLDIAAKRCYNIIEDKEFLPRRTQSCNWCDYNQYCEVLLAGGEVEV